MAEEVKITGGNGDLDGAVLENAASEKTLSDLLNLFKSKGKTGDKVLELHQRAVEENIDAIEESTQDYKVASKTLDKVNASGKKLNDTLMTIVGGGFGLLFTGLAATGNILLDFFTDSLDAFRETSAVGAGFNNSLIDLRRASADAAMPLDEFVKNIKENSKLFSTLGGTVTEGAKRFGTLSKQLRTGDIGQQLLSMGFTTSDVNDGLINYMTIQERMGKLDKNNTQGLVKETQNYLVELDKLSKATGISRKALEDELAKASLDPIIEQMMEGADKANVAANLGMVAEVGGKNLQDALKEVATGVVRSDLAKRLVGLGVSAEQAQDVFTGADPKKVQGFLVGLGETIEDEGILRDKTLMQARADFAELGSVALKSRVLAKKNLDQAAAEQQKRDKLTGALSVIGQLFTSIQSEITSALLDSGVFTMIADGLAKIGDLFIAYSPQITQAVKELIAFFDTGAKTFFNNIDTMGVKGAIIDLLKNIFSALGKAMLDGIGEMFSSIFTKTRDLMPEEKQTIDKHQSRISDINETLSNLRQSQQMSGDTGFGKSQQEEIQKQIDMLEKERKESSEIINVITEATKESRFSLEGLTGSVKDTFKSASNVVSEFFGMSSAQAGEMTDEIREKLKTVSGEDQTSTITDAFTSIDNSIKSIDWAGIITLLGGVGGAFGTFYAASNLMSLAAKGLTSTIAPMLAFGAAIGMGTGGIGLMLEGISGVIEKSANALDMLPTSIKKFEDIDPNKITNLSSPLINLSEAVALFSVGGILSLISGNGLTKLSESLMTFNNINVDNINNTVSGISNLKSNLDFGAQTEQVNSFITSIDSLIEKIKNLEETIKNSNNATEIVKAKTSVSNSGIGSQTTAGTANADQQNQLNKLVEQLLLVTQEMNDVNKDILSATKGRGNPI